MNRLLNPGFESGWIDRFIGGRQVQQPRNWWLSARAVGEVLESAGAFDGIDHPPVVEAVVAIPECVHMLAEQLPPWEQPGGADPLILDGQAVYKVFLGNGAFSARLEQDVVGLTPGARARFSVPARVHSNPYPGGDGSPGACAFRLECGPAASPWLTFGHGLQDRQWVAVEVEATVPHTGELTVAVVMESRSEAGVDFFIDALSLVEIYPPDPPDPPPVDYAVVVNLLPQDATLDEKWRVLSETHAGRETILQSADDAARLVAPGADGSLVRAWWPERWGDIGTWLLDNGVEVIEYAPDDDEPPPPPPTDWQPRRYITHGSGIGWHTMGSNGLAELAARHGLQPESVKVVQTLGSMSEVPGKRKVARLIDWPGAGNIEGFAFHGDPIAQAEQRVGAVLGAMAPYLDDIDYVELVNEQAPNGDEEAARNFARFWMRCCEIWPDTAARIAAFSFATGTPEPIDWQRMAEEGVFEALAAGGHAIALHAYWMPDDEGAIYWHLLRHRHTLYDPIILPRQLDIPLLMTELGPPPFLPPEQMPDMLALAQQADALLRDDPYFAGGHLFTLSVGGAWPGYDTAWRAVAEDLTAWLASVQDRENG